MKISVYITSYNQKKLLREAIESVLSQTLRPYEIIIVDDCSDDGSQDLIREYAHQNPGLIKPLFHTKNVGVTRTRNHALSAVSGDFVTYLDGDDRYLPRKLELEAAALQRNSTAQIVYSNYYICRSSNPSDRELWIQGDFKPPEGFNLRQIFGRSFPYRTIYKMELVNYRFWQHVGTFDTHLNLWEDFDMRIRLAQTAHAVYVHEPLAEYYRHETGLSRAPITAHLASLCYIYEKKDSTLGRLPARDRLHAERELTDFMVGLAQQAADRLSNRPREQVGERLHLMRFFFWHRKHQPQQLGVDFLQRMLLPRRYHYRL